MLTKPLLGLSNKSKIATTEKKNIQIEAQILKHQAWKRVSFLEVEARRIISTNS